MSHRRSVLAGLAVATAIMLAGCAQHPSDPGSTPATTSSASASPSVSASASPTPSSTATQALCASGGLTAALARQPDHSAGQTHYTVTVTNSATQACPLPATTVTVQPEASAGGKALGNPASSAPVPASTLAPGATVTVQFALVNSQNYDPQSCSAGAAAALRIAWGSSGAAADLALPAPVQVCTSASIANVLQVTLGS